MLAGQLTLTHYHVTPEPRRIYVCMQPEFRSGARQCFHCYALTDVILQHCLNGVSKTISLVCLQAGTLEVLVDALPGLPDGISRSSDGNFWVPLVAKPPAASKYFRLPAFRALLSWIPDEYRPAVPVWGAVLKVGLKSIACSCLLEGCLQFVLLHCNYYGVADGPH
jgi:hypothetical protein